MFDLRFRFGVPKDYWATAILFVLSLGVTRAQLTSTGYPVVNPDWEIHVTDYGYADVALDMRPGFVGREYLSGEWAAAVFYAGGHNPVGPIWFQPQWFFPDWVSNSNFNVVQAFAVANPASPLNSSGFTVYRSIIANLDVRVTMTYEMLDSATGIPQGTTPKSTPGAGSSLLSSRYVFKQTYRIENISGGTLTNLRLFQFLHGLHTSKSLYDDRSYTGAMSAYRYDNTQQGDSYSFDSRTGEIVQHHDTIAMHSQILPAAWEVGYYGKKGVDSHTVGKPPVGVHLKVEANSLNNLDFFQPAEKGYVSGAMQFNTTSLAAGASITHDVLFTVQTTGEVKFSGAKVVVRDFKKSGNNFLLDFQETVGGPLGFILHKSSNLALPLDQWETLALPYTIDFPQPGWRRFQIPFNAAERKAFYRIEAVIQQ